ncbi:N-acetylglucosamine metabolism protein [Candidatus Magnetoovum chiemensis]|nr:N-acetylglucosamine metabolism protein [Candidatus Magnetoovum chiemensis]
MENIMIKAVICDMDGVIYRGSKLIEGAKSFVCRLIDGKVKFLFLTNNSEQTPERLKNKLFQLGIERLSEENFITSAMATASFLKQQNPSASIYVVGGKGLEAALVDCGLTITDSSPDYVVVGKTGDFNFEMMRRAINLINKGAKFIGTNPDILDPIEGGIEPACGAILASIERGCGISPYIIGKPNSLMMTIATRKLNVHPENTLVIGDRMDTDIVGGLEAGMRTCLVLSGVTTKETADAFPYRADYIFNSVGDIYLDKL